MRRDVFLAGTTYSPTRFGEIPDGHSSAEDAGERIRRLEQAARPGHVPAIHQLALLCNDVEQKKRLLWEAAHEGYVPAMYDYALLCLDPRHRNRWLRMAAEEGHVAAMHALAMSLVLRQD